MRTFDYWHLPRNLFEGAIGEANARAFEDKGKLDMLEMLHPELLDSLRQRAHFDSVDASAHIEGLYTAAGRTQAVLDGAQPADEVEFQIAGYSKALGLIEADPVALDLSTSTLLAFFETLYAHRDLGRKSRYRKKDFAYVQVDGHMQAMPVSPVTAFETPLVLGGACDSLADVFGEGAASPLILSAVFTVDFLCIRPFDEGNGRISRLMADLALAKAGFNVARFASIDRIIEESAMDYYDALNSCVEGWDRGRNDYGPYVRYWLDVVHQAHERLFDMMSDRTHEKAGKSERVKQFVERAGAPVTKRQIIDALPDISEATVESALGKMVKEGLAEKVGASRSTAYQWRG